MSNGGRDRGRTHVQTYTNARGDRRMQISMSVETALKVAAGDEEASGKIVAAVASEVEAETKREATPTDG